MYTYTTRIKLHETDAAGRLFFAELLKIAHDAYESFLLDHGFPLRDLDTRYEFSLPIVHAEADYLGELCASDKIQVIIHLNKIGASSYILNYDFQKESGEPVCKVRTVHVVVNLASGKKMPVPDRLKEMLQTLS